jgi:hypothetical protein
MRYSARSWTIVNIPLSTTGQFEQYVYNPLAPAWFRLTDISAYCWQMSGTKILFGGGDGSVYHWDDGTTRSDLGAAVVADLGMAWDNYGSNTTKTFTLVRPYFMAVGVVNPLINMRTNYDDHQPLSAVEASTSEEGEAWDDGTWDEFEWGGGFERFAPWLSASGEGVVAAPRIVVSTTTADIQLQAVEVVFVPGGIL